MVFVSFFCLIMLEIWSSAIFSWFANKLTWTWSKKWKPFYLPIYRSFDANLTFILLTIDLGIHRDLNIKIMIRRLGRLRGKRIQLSQIDTEHVHVHRTMFCFQAVKRFELNNRYLYSSSIDVQCICRLDKRSVGRSAGRLADCFNDSTSTNWFLWHLISNSYWLRFHYVRPTTYFVNKWQS